MRHFLEWVNPVACPSGLQLIKVDIGLVTPTDGSAGPHSKSANVGSIPLVIKSGTDRTRIFRFTSAFLQFLTFKESFRILHLHF